MSVRSASSASSRVDPLLAANSDPPSASASIHLPGLRTRSVVLDHSLQAQWRGTAGRAPNTAAYVSDSQRLWILLSLFLLAALLVVCSLHFSEPTELHMHPVARLPPEHPHSLKKAAMAAAKNAQIVDASSASLVSSDYCVIYVTVPSASVGTALSSGLLESKLVACANLVPGISSMYWWEGKIQTDQEQLLMLKTRTSLFSAVAAFVSANHPYQTPEIIQLPIQQGSKSYLQWIQDSTQETAADGQQ